MAYRSPLFDIPSDLIRTVRGVFSLAGRSRRTEVWTWLIVINLLLGLFDLALAAAGVESEASDGDLIEVSTVLALGFCIPIPALIVRRLHDFGWSGWIASVVPLWLVAKAPMGNGEPLLLWFTKDDLGVWGWLNLAVGVGLLVICLVPPDWGSNRYGANPRLGEPEG